MAKGIPVVISTNGLGVPVIPVQGKAPLMTVASNGLGLPIIPVESGGAPMVLRNADGSPYEGSEAVPTEIGGVAVGDAGTAGTIYEGLKLAGGDDFDAAPTRWTGKNLSGKYAHSALSYGFRGTNPGQDRIMYIDPAFRGTRSESPTDLGYDGVSVGSSVATLTASPVPTELLPYLPATYTNWRGDANNKPRLISGSLKTSPHFMISAQADFVAEAKIRLAPGVARGYWPSFWTSSFFWPDRGEIDIAEVKKDSTGVMKSLLNIFGNASDGAPSQYVTVATPTLPAEQWIHVVAKRAGNTVSFYDDADVPGTLALRGSSSSFVARLSGAHDIRLDLAVSTEWDASTFDMADWPKQVEFDWWRVWVPASAGANPPTMILPAIDVVPGGSWATTLPARAALFGDKPGIEQVSAAWDNFDAPGMSTRNNATRLPASMSVNLATRAVTGTVPGSEGGCMPLLLTYAYDDGTPAARVMLPYRVAPALQSIFASQNLAAGASVNLTIGYTAFHSGNLGPHTYTVSADKGWLNIAGNGTGTVSIAGTAPSAEETATITIRCINSVGQVTEIARTLAVAAVPTMFFEDTFTAPGGTLAGHVSDSGAAWSKHPLSPSTHSLSGFGGIYQPGAGEAGLMMPSAAPPNADYYVEADLLIKTVITGASIAICGRMSSADLTYYGLRYTAGSFILFKSVAGTLTTLGTYAATQPTNVAGIMRLEMKGNQVSGLVNGVLRIGPVADTSVAAAGSVGTRIYGVSATVTAGQHFEGVRAGALAP